MKPYLVRLRSDQKNAREIVGFYVSPSLDHLAEMVDECCPPEDCEYRELGPGGIFWTSFTNSPVPRAQEPDWEDLPEDWSVIPPGAMLSPRWDGMFHAGSDPVADDKRWTPLRWENDKPELDVENDD
jgi:hypothetical protein